MINHNILQYESKIWATADLLRGCGIKESEWSSYMMPFFALLMVESRLVRIQEGLQTEISPDQSEVQKRNQGDNTYIFEKNQTLPDICQNEQSFDVDFAAYLEGFDRETKELLGVEITNGEKFLRSSRYN